jgi:hypothetical protein
LNEVKSGADFSSADPGFRCAQSMLPFWSAGLLADLAQGLKPMAKTNPNIRLVAEMLELADGMLAAKIMDAATHRKIIQRKASPSQNGADASGVC